MTLGEKVLCFTIILIALFCGISAFKPTTFGDAVNGYPFNKTTSGQISLTSGTSTSVVLANSARTFERFCNNNSSSSEFLSFGNTATITSGTLLTAGTCYQMTGTESIFTGQVSATTASSATTTLLFITNP